MYTLFFSSLFFCCILLMGQNGNSVGSTQHLVALLEGELLSSELGGKMDVAVKLGDTFLQTKNTATYLGEEYVQLETEGKSYWARLSTIIQGKQNEREHSEKDVCFLAYPFDSLLIQHPSCPTPIRGKVILHTPSENKSTVVPIYTAPDISKPFCQKNVLEHYHIFAKKSVSGKVWYLVGNNPSFIMDHAGHTLVGWVESSNLILSNGQMLEFSACKERSQGKIYADEQSLRDALGGRKHATLGEELDIEFERYWGRFAILGKNELEYNGQKIGLYKVAFLAHNCKVGLEQQALIEALQKRMQETMQIDIAVLLDATLSNRIHQGTIENRLQSFWKDLEDIPGLEKLKSHPFLQECIKQTTTPKIRMGILAYRDSSSVKEVDGKLYNTEANFYDFVSSQKEFLENYRRIVFAGGSGSQSSNFKALQALTNGKFTSSNPNVENPSLETNFSWAKNSVKLILMIGDVGQSELQDWTNQNLVEWWESKNWVERPIFLFVQQGKQNTREGYQNFQNFANRINNRINALAKDSIQKGKYSLSSQNEQEQTRSILYSPLAQYGFYSSGWNESPLGAIQAQLFYTTNNIIQSIQRMIAHHIRQEAKERKAIFVAFGNDRMLRFLAYTEPWDDRIYSEPNIPAEYHDYIRYDKSNKRVMIQRVITNPKILENLKNIHLSKPAYKMKWKKTVEKLNDTIRQKPMDLQATTLFYNQGYVLEENFLPEPPFSKNKEKITTYCLYMHQNYLVCLIERLKLLVENYEGSYREYCKTKQGHFPILCVDNLKKEMIKRGMITPANNRMIEPDEVVFPNGFWTLSFEDMGKLSENQWKNIYESAKKQLPKIQDYHKQEKNWRMDEYDLSYRWTYVPLDVVDIQHQ